MITLNAPGRTTGGIPFVYTAADELCVGDVFYTSAAVGLHTITAIREEQRGIDRYVYATCDDGYPGAWLYSRLARQGDMHNWAAKVVRRGEGT